MAHLFCISLEKTDVISNLYLYLAGPFHDSNQNLATLLLSGYRLLGDDKMI
jgi:hypothetical protein